MWQKWKFRRAMRKARNNVLPSEMLLKQQVVLLEEQVGTLKCELEMMRWRLLLLAPSHSDEQIRKSLIAFAMPSKNYLN